MICLKIRTFVVSATTKSAEAGEKPSLWFAWKFVPLWYQQQLNTSIKKRIKCCDLLENSYLCGISNNTNCEDRLSKLSCDLLENSYLCGISNNPGYALSFNTGLWFAWKFVPLWYQQQRKSAEAGEKPCCDLLENSYLCGISNNAKNGILLFHLVVICLKIRTFVVSATTFRIIFLKHLRCDLLENSYLCGISNNLWI